MKLMLTTLFVSAYILLFAQAPTTVSTFHNISVYWSPAQGADNTKALIKYKATGSEQWKTALAMVHHPIPDIPTNPTTNERYDKADYRGSIVNLVPGQTYDIQVTLEGTNISQTIQATTWSEDFPIGETITLSNSNTRYHAEDLVGTANGYKLLDGTNKTIDITDNSDQCIFLENCSYVIVRGATLKNGGKHGIQMANCHHIVIENCDISAWGEEDIAGTGFGKDYQSAVFAPDHDARHCVIQRNKIHHPKWDTNSWSELHDPAADPDIFENYHPEGPQGVGLGHCDVGNNVIRYNEFWSDEDHYFNDIIGKGKNASYEGSPGADSDIYGNYIANCYDDGIESEGGNMNVRIWNNYIEKMLIAIGNAPTSIGPLYVWKNVSGKSYTQNGNTNNYGGFLKMGTAGSLDWMTGDMYIFNNTILQTNDQGVGGLGTHDESSRHVRYCVSRNNILQVREETTHSVSVEEQNIHNNFDYDLMNKAYPAGHESHGISGTPTYEALSFDFVTKTGNFRLSTDSKGFDEGEIIPNFSDGYLGAAPDMGAHEAGTDPIVYGINADFQSPLPVEYLTPFWGAPVSNGIRLSWLTSSETNADYFIIQRLTANIWQDLEKVNAGAYNYRLLDQSPSIGNNIYRLKQVDLDGQFVYSNLISVNWRQPLEIVLHPNPTQGTTQFSDHQPHKVVIKNMLGQVVYASESTSVIYFSRKGIYTALVYGQDGISQTTLVIQ